MLNQPQNYLENLRIRRDSFLKIRTNALLPKTSHHPKKNARLSIPSYKEMKITISPDTEPFSPDIALKTFSSVETFSISPRKTLKTAATKSRTSLSVNDNDLIKSVMQRFTPQNKEVLTNLNKNTDNQNIPKSARLSFRRQKSNYSQLNTPTQEHNKNFNFGDLRVQIPSYRRQKSQFSPTQIAHMDDLIQKINDDREAKDLQTLKKTIKKCASDLSSRIENLKKITKIDLQEIKEQRLKRWNRNKFKDYEQELTSKEINEMLGRMKDEFKKFSYL